MLWLFADGSNTAGGSKLTEHQPAFRRRTCRCFDGAFSRSPSTWMEFAQAHRQPSQPRTAASLHEATGSFGDCSSTGYSGAKKRRSHSPPVSFPLSLELLPDSTVRNSAFALLTSNQVESFAHKTPTRSQSSLRPDARSFRVRPHSVIPGGKLDKPPFQCISDIEPSADRHNRPRRAVTPPQPPPSKPPSREPPGL
jgi:hypothetical protein